MLLLVRWFGVGVFLLAAGLFIAWITTPDPRYNGASFEEQPLEMRLAPIEQAITLAQYQDQVDSNRVRTLVVLEMGKDVVVGVDLENLGSIQTNDPFEALATADISPLLSGESSDLEKSSIEIRRLLPSGPNGAYHIGTGTNFPEHAEETNSHSVFQFPKFGTASSSRTEIQAKPGILLDYEVELCMRFDRDIAAPGQFDEAVKGIFLCGDFTNRNALIMLANADNLDSGHGFSDAKSGPDRFPTGPFLVIPKDWKAFVSDLRMTTSVNGANRQDARGREMTLDFRQLVHKAFTDMDAPRFLYRDEYVRLTPNGVIPSSMALMSGTSEGTIFTPPSRGDLIEAMLVYTARGGPLSGDEFLDSARQTFIANEIAGNHFLKPGDIVRHASNYLGDIEVKVVD